MSSRAHAGPNAEQLGQVADLIASGEVRIEVARTFALADYHEAYRFARDGHARGKTVLTIK